MLLDRNKIPFNHSGIVINFPKIQIENFNNTKIYKYHDNTQPLVNFKLNFKSGAVLDKIPGLANFTMSMFQGGTSSMNSSQLSEEFEKLGATYFSNAYWDECAIGFTCLEKYFDKCLDLVAQCVFDSQFADDEIERQRQKIAANIMHNLSDPSYLAQVTFNKGIFLNHPYSNQRTGTLDDVSSITRNDIVECYKLMIEKSSTSIIVTGNFDDNSFNQKISAKFLPISNNTGIDAVESFRRIHSPHLISAKDESSQTNLRIGKASIDRKNPDYPAFQVINTIFGGYFLSRLNTVLRETKGLTYGIHSYLDSRKYGSAFIISTGINCDKTSESIDDIFEISDKLTSEKLTNTEIERSVEFMTGSFARTLETPKQITGLIQTIDSYDLDLSFLSDFYSRIRQLSADDLIIVQEKYFHSSDYLIAANGDVDYLSSSLSKFGKFEVIAI